LLRLKKVIFAVVDVKRSKLVAAAYAGRCPAWQTRPSVGSGIKHFHSSLLTLRQNKLERLSVSSSFEI